jgi:hypothetical protein
LDKLLAKKRTKNALDTTRIAVGMFLSILAKVNCTNQ